MEAGDCEQSLVLIKPDALKLSLTGYVLSTLAEVHTGLRFAGAKIVHVSRMLAEEHYADLRKKPFFPSVIDYIMGRIHYSGEPEKRRVVALVYSGKDAVKRIREVVGPTNPNEARDHAPGTLRALGAIVPAKDANGVVMGERLDNLVHASASAADAEREIRLWFKPNDIIPTLRLYPTETADEHYYYCLSEGGTLKTTYAPGRTCLMAPGDLVWRSDLEILRALIAGRPTPGSLTAVVVKYLINEKAEV